jgi:hypothetical protein
MTLVVPWSPARLTLALRRRWDGSACPDPHLHGRVALSARGPGLWVEGFLPDPAPAKLPDAPAGQRVSDLWHYDVVECFLVGEGGRYLEVELGAGGHFLVLCFDAPRRLADAHPELRPDVEHRRDGRGWRTALTLPWACVPAGLCGLDAFVSAKGEHLAWAPLPGPAPDFHQPHRFPPARLTR